jgi:DNA polymerase-3 subunit epsilon
MAELGRLLSDRVLVAHNATFDWRFLAAESRRADHQLPVARRLCTVALTRHLDLPVASLSLASVASYYGITQGRAHDAIDDMRVMAEVLLRLLIAAEQVELPLPLITCDPADAVRAYPARSTRRTCRWTYPGKWAPGEQLIQGMKVAVTGDLVGCRRVQPTRLDNRCHPAGIIRSHLQEPETSSGGRRMMTLSSIFMRASAVDISGGLTRATPWRPSPRRWGRGTA